MRTNIDKFVSL